MQRTAWPLLLALPLALVGCRDEKISAYRIPKEKEEVQAPHDANHGKKTDASSAPASAPAATAPGTAAPAPSGGGSSMANTAVATASGPGLAWTGPAHWQAKGAAGMRKGTFTLTGDGGATADLAITAFPGDVGGEVANVNRWRGQIQLPPLSPAEAGASVQRLDSNGLKIGVVEMASTGANATRVLGAMVPHEGATWFFKLTGPDALVAKEKPAFMEFIKTIKPTTAK